MITSLDRQTVKTLQEEMLQAMKAVAERHGLTVTNKGGRFTTTSSTMKFEVATRSSTGEVNSREREAFKAFAPMHGLAVTDLDRVFRSQDKAYKICGLKTGRSAYPVLATRVDTGTTYKFSASRVRALLAISVPIGS